MSYEAPAVYASLIEPRYATVADALVAAAALRPHDDVLELGAGTGVVTRRAAPAVRSLLATDLSPWMLDHARRSLRGQRHVTYALLDYGGAYPLLDSTFSLVLSGLTYVQDSSAALAEVARVLKGSGRLALSMWGSSYMEKRLMNAALASISGDRFPNAAPTRAVKRLERLGFRSIRRSDLDVTTSFRTVNDYIAYRRGFGIPTAWNRSFYERFLRALERQASRVATSDGRLELGWAHTLITARPPPRSGSVDT